MERELEIAGAASLGGLLRRKAKAGPAPGSACANCGAILQGPYCHACGQPAGDHHRSIWVLAWEGVESLTHLDGRLAQTLPPLFLDPGRLARDFLEGRRQRHVPPFRLFLVSLLIFMLVLEVPVPRRPDAPTAGQQRHRPRRQVRGQDAHRGGVRRTHARRRSERTRQAGAG
ncbi:MAG: DUF3667 domain-containing protein [Caulobacteraceae bacterium]